VEYAIASPTTAYSAHGCSAQWRYEYCMATRAASIDPGCAASFGGVARCERGSATPKNISPMPIPALNIIATHEAVLNSGRSSSRPSRILP
jgi:hypothetical protein